MSSLKARKSFRFSVYVDGVFVADEVSEASSPVGAGPLGLFNACCKKANALAWFVADQAQATGEPLSRSQVTWEVLLRPEECLMPQGLPSTQSSEAMEVTVCVRKAS